MKPLRKKDLIPEDELTRTFFRVTNPQRAEEDFTAKWRAAVRSPFALFRAFPEAYWIDLNQVDGERIPSCATDRVVFGDAHPENFGTLTFEEGPAFVYNDLDDADTGNAAVDALRFFTAAVLQSDDKDELDLLIDEYANVMQDLSKPAPVPVASADELAARDAAFFERFVRERRLVLAEETRLLALEDADRGAGAAILHALQSSGSPWLKRLEVCDMAIRAKASGGSAGLHRRWLLVLDPESGREDVVEIKELDLPSPAWGDLDSPVEVDRVESAKNALWPDLHAKDHVVVTLAATPYLVRSRLGSAKTRLKKLAADDRLAVLKAEVGILARHHQKAYKPVEIPPVLEWLLGSARMLRKRWLTMWERLEEEDW